MWALEGWGLADYQWARDALGITRGWRDNLFMIEWIANILKDFKGALGALSVDQRFDPTNKGFLLMF